MVSNGRSKKIQLFFNFVWREPLFWTVNVQPSGRLEESEVGVGGLHFDFTIYEGSFDVCNLVFRNFYLVFGNLLFDIWESVFVIWETSIVLVFVSSLYFWIFLNHISEYFCRTGLFHYWIRTHQQINNKCTFKENCHFLPLTLSLKGFSCPSLSLVPFLQIGEGEFDFWEVIWEAHYIFNLYCNNSV